MFRRMIAVTNGVCQLQVMDNCRYTIRAIPAAQTDPHLPEQYDTKGDDHPLDAICYGCRKNVLTPEEMRSLDVTQHVTKAWGSGGWR